MQAKDAHRSAKREGGPVLPMIELRTASHPSLKFQAKGSITSELT